MPKPAAAAEKEAEAESEKQKYAAQAQANYAKSQTALEKYTAVQNELNKALKEGHILQADYAINMAAAKKEYEATLKKRRNQKALKFLLVIVLLIRLMPKPCS